ncbi:MAG: pyridoxamine 5'-phosphate oxidase family protein [Pseudomonadota bacterium]
MKSREKSEALGREYCWRAALKLAVSKNRRDAHNRYLQLATVRSDGSPAVRSLVFRGFDEATATLAMITDLRSQKVAEISTSDQGEVCWYFTHTREQFRLSGRLTLIGAESEDQPARRALWLGPSLKDRCPLVESKVSFC